ncbi:entericidin A/B family lipoprotein [Blastomonas sp.]
MVSHSRLRIAIVAGLLVSVLSACNTVSGVGRDVESVGKTLDKAAN